MSALHFACLYGDFGVARCLVGAGADVNLTLCTKRARMTALHFAIEQVQVDLVRLLVEAGADVNVMLEEYSHLHPLQLVRKHTGYSMGPVRIRLSISLIKSPSQSCRSS